MKTKHPLFFILILSITLSCSTTKENYNIELSKEMELKVDYINNKMPSTDKGSTKYISFMVFPKNDTFTDNWKTVSLTATSGDLNVDILKFDKNEFEAKGEKVYRNNARMGLSELGSTIDITIILTSESGERVKLSKSGVQEQVVE